MSVTKRAYSALPKQFGRATVLLLLLEQPAHGYELIERLQPFGFQAADSGGLYRTLRSLEAAGLVDSAWQQSETGPDRNVYEITEAGREELHERAREMAAVLNLFLSRYLEFVNPVDVRTTAA